MNSIRFVIYGLVISISLLTCQSSEAKKEAKTTPDPKNATLTLDGKPVADVQAAASYMVFQGNLKMINVTFRWDLQKDGQVEVSNRLFMINAYGLQTGSYKVVQVAQKAGTGGMAYVIRKNEEGDQQNFGVLKKGTLSFTKIDTTHHTCSGKCTITLQDNNGSQTAIFTAQWEDLPMNKSRMP